MREWRAVTDPYQEYLHGLKQAARPWCGRLHEAPIFLTLCSLLSRAGIECAQQTDTFVALPHANAYSPREQVRLRWLDCTAS